jgi:hypothetical protein
MFASGAVLEASTWRGDALLEQFSLVPLKIGMFRLQPLLILTNLGYDANIYSRPDPVSDYSLTVGPQIDGFVSIRKKVIFTFSESPRYVYFLHTARERTWNNYLKGDVNILLNDVFISAGAWFNDSKERWSWEIDLRPRLKETGEQGLILWQLSRKTSFSLTFRQAQYEYENLTVDQADIAERLNRTESTLSLSAYHELTSQARVYVEFALSGTDFQSPLNRNSNRSGGVYGGVEFSTLGRVHGRLRLGYKSYQPLTIGLPVFQGLVGDTSVWATVLRVLVVRGTYERDVRPSIWYGNAFYIENSWSLGAGLYFLRRLFRVDYDFSYGHNAYPAATLAGNSAGLPAINRDDQIRQHRIGLFFRIGKDLGLGLQASRSNRKINIYSWDITGNSIGISLIHGF